MNRAIFTVSEWMLRAALGLPDDVRVLAVGGDTLRQAQGRFEVMVEGPGLPAVKEGQAIPIASPSFRLEEGERPRLVSWGV